MVFRLIVTMTNEISYDSVVFDEGYWSHIRFAD